MVSHTELATAETPANLERMNEMTSREAYDNGCYARAWNKEIKKGRLFYAISPLTGQSTPVCQFRTRKGHLEAKSERTGNWLGVAHESVRRSY